MNLTNAKVTTAPTSEPVTLAEAKAHLNIGHNADDSYITALIVAARIQVENDTRRALMPQTWSAYADHFPGPVSRLPVAPVTAISSVKYYGADGGAAVTVASTVYEADLVDEPARMALAYLQSWPSATLRNLNGFEVVFTAGYANAAAVPQALKHAMLLLIGNWYLNRESVVAERLINPIELPMAYHALIDPYRVRL